MFRTQMSFPRYYIWCENNSEFKILSNLNSCWLSYYYKSSFFFCTDLAVGAPYEEGGGTVYIYSGSAAGIITTPSQVIKIGMLFFIFFIIGSFCIYEAKLVFFVSSDQAL